MTRTTHRSPHARLGLGPRASAKDAKAARDEVVTFLEGAPPNLSSWAQGQIAATEEAYAAARNPARAPQDRGAGLRRLVLAVATLGVSAAVVVGIYNMGGDEGKDVSGAATAEESKLSPGDEVQVGKLMGRLEANPDDAALLIELGNIYFEAGDYNSAVGWMKRAVAIEPGNVKARLALGASEFNLGDEGAARKAWERVIELDPENVEAYYDLGFLYVSEDPPEMVEAKKMWRRVVALAPDSAVAKTVATHLEGLKKSGSPAATPPPGEG